VLVPFEEIAAERREPFQDDRSNGGLAFERVGAGDAGEGAVRAFGRHPERVALALDNEGRDFDGVELGEAALLGATGRVDWEREAEDGDRLGRGCGAACDPGA
jgi:hypothetical protein